MEAGEGVDRAVRKLGVLEMELGYKLGILTALYWRRKKPILAAVERRHGHVVRGKTRDYIFLIGAEAEMSGIRGDPRGMKA